MGKRGGAGGMGRVSLLIAVITAVAILILFLCAVPFIAKQGGQLDAGSAVLMIIGLLVLGAWGLALIGLVFGVSGLLREDGDKRLAKMGLAANALVLVLSVGLTCAGYVRVLITTG